MAFAVFVTEGMMFVISVRGDIGLVSDRAKKLMGNVRDYVETFFLYCIRHCEEIDVQ